MAIRSILFDLDDTLAIEGASANAAFLATCAHAHKTYDINSKALHQAVRYHAGALWRASATITYCRAIGISSWEGLWARFLGNDPNLKRLRRWAPVYRRETWFRALADYDVQDLTFAEQLSAIFMSERRTRHIVFPDVEDNLTTLQKTYQLALVTNGAPDLQREKIQGARLGQYFDEILISGEVGIGKPDSRIFKLALDTLAASPSEAVMVGDSLDRDILGAQRAGIKGIWMNRSGNKANDQVTPDVQVTSLSQLHGLLPILADAKEM
ncbi:MAG: HAD family hydrolase [Candidatus Poribacteria bacterium]|nr:HAD family hydrolase [Candidatus Poribacteria bacterium]